MVGHHVGPEHCLEAWEDNVGVFHEGGHMVTQAMFRDFDATLFRWDENVTEYGKRPG